MSWWLWRSTLDGEQWAFGAIDAADPDEARAMVLHEFRLAGLIGDDEHVGALGRGVTVTVDAVPLTRRTA